MKFSLCEHIRVTMNNDKLIILDMIKDKYVILKDNYMKYFIDIIQDEFYLANNQYLFLTKPIYPDKVLIINDFIGKLMDLRYICVTNHGEMQSNKIIKEKNLLQNFDVPSINWQMNKLSLKSKCASRLVAEAFLTLAKINYIIKTGGMYKLVKKLHQYKLNAKNPVDLKLCNQIMHAVNKAAFFYPCKTKCLEWAATFVVIALKKGMKCNLSIGVQNVPFYAHAWVQAEEGVIADYHDLPNRMSVILLEPFKDQA